MRLAIGTGTGRCGSKSLRVLCMAQPQCGVTHERMRLPWVDGETHLAGALSAWQATAAGERPSRALWERDVEHEGAWNDGEKVVGDIGPWYLPLVPLLVERHGAQVIHLERDCATFVLSVLSGNALLADTPEIMSPRTRAAHMYWSLTHTLAAQYAQQYPEAFCIWHTPDLNSQYHQREMMRWIGVEDPVALEAYPAAAENRLSEITP